MSQSSTILRSSMQSLVLRALNVGFMASKSKVLDKGEPFIKHLHPSHEQISCNVYAMPYISPGGGRTPRKPPCPRGARSGGGGGILVGDL